MRLIVLFFCILSGLVGFAQNSETYQALLDSALQASSNNRLPQAEMLYKRVLEMEPSNPTNSLVWGNLGSVQYRLGNTQAALQSYTMALNLQPKLVPVLEQRADLYMEMNDKTHALFDYSAILDVDPSHEQALLGRASLRMEQRMYQEAQLDLETLLYHYPQHKQGELGLAILSQKQERYKESAERFAILLEKYPNDPTLYEARGNMEREAKLYELALLDYEEAGRISKDPFYNVMQALVYLDQGKKKTARIMLDRAVRGGESYASLKDIYLKCK